jgi:hypothetical protein
VFVATLHRLFVSGSDRDCSVWMEDYDIAGAQGLGLHHFYRAVAWLGEEIEDKRADALAPRCVKDAIEEKLHAGMEAVAARSRSAATGATRASRGRLAGAHRRRAECRGAVPRPSCRTPATCAATRAGQGRAAIVIRQKASAAKKRAPRPPQGVVPCRPEFRRNRPKIRGLRKSTVQVGLGEHAGSRDSKITAYCTPLSNRVHRSPLAQTDHWSRRIYTP